MCNSDLQQRVILKYTYTPTYNNEITEALRGLYTILSHENKITIYNPKGYPYGHLLTGSKNYLFTTSAIFRRIAVLRQYFKL